MDTLQMLAGSSGGKMHLVAGDEDLRPLAAQIAPRSDSSICWGLRPRAKGM